MEKEQKFSKKNKIIFAVILVIAVVYFGGVFYYSGHFLNKTVINGINCSNKTVDQMEDHIEKNIKSYELKITERKNLSDTVKGSDIKLTYLENDVIQKYKESQNAFAWPVRLFGKTEKVSLKTTSYDEEKLNDIINDFHCFEKKNITVPRSAYPEYAGNNKYKIVAEEDGNKVIKKKLKEAVKTCISGGDETLDLEKANCYLEPKYRKDSKEIVQLKADMESMVKGSITWDYSERYINPVKFKDLLDKDKVTVGGDVTNKFIKIKNKTKAVISKQAIEDWLVEYAGDTNTIYNGRRFKTHSGQMINVTSGGPYGWRMDVEKETKAIRTMMKEGTTKTRKPYYKQKAQTGTFGKINDIGKSYVEVDITNQMVYVYKNGKQVFATDCVTGNTSKGTITHPGVGVIQYKTRNKTLGGVGYTYSSFVRYWMPFNGGEGLHDADWRSSFGGSIYKTGGSHGCVNLPIYAAATIYGIIDAGWPVVVY